MTLITWICNCSQSHSAILACWARIYTIWCLQVNESLSQNYLKTFLLIMYFNFFFSFLVWDHRVFCFSLLQIKTCNQLYNLKILKKIRNQNWKFTRIVSLVSSISWLRGWDLQHSEEQKPQFLKWLNRMFDKIKYNY